MEASCRGGCKQNRQDPRRGIKSCGVEHQPRLFLWTSSFTWCALLLSYRVSGVPLNKFDGVLDLLSWLDLYVGSTLLAFNHSCMHAFPLFFSGACLSCIWCLQYMPIKPLQKLKQRSSRWLAFTEDHVLPRFPVLTKEKRNFG